VNSRRGRGPAARAAPAWPLCGFLIGAGLNLVQCHPSGKEPQVLAKSTTATGHPAARSRSRGPNSAGRSRSSTSRPRSAGRPSVGSASSRTPGPVSTRRHSGPRCSHPPRRPMRPRRRGFGEHFGQPVDLDGSGGRGGIHAASAAPVHRQQAQMRQRAHRVGCQSASSAAGGGAHRRAADMCALASPLRGGSPMFAGLASPMASNDVRRVTRSYVTPGTSVDDALAAGGGSVMRQFRDGLTCTDAARKTMGFLWGRTVRSGPQTCDRLADQPLCLGWVRHQGLEPRTR
jgi:hypothetical protein